mmetsp:Transcript_5640/g.17097  ORF Transcript_5640/g.17097 Transcript_5640/m.17097 type:complete len:252 (-) Transcript_5640:56-811(-)
MVEARVWQRGRVAALGHRLELARLELFDGGHQRIEPRTHARRGRVQRVAHQLGAQARAVLVEEAVSAVHVAHQPARALGQRRQAAVDVLDGVRVRARLHVLVKLLLAGALAGFWRVAVCVVRRVLPRRGRHLRAHPRRRSPRQDARQQNLGPRKPREHLPDDGAHAQEDVVGLVVVAPHVVGADGEDHHARRVAELELAAAHAVQQVLRAVAADAEGVHVAAREGALKRLAAWAQLVVRLAELRAAHRLGD